MATGLGDLSGEECGIDRLEPPSSRSRRDQRATLQRRIEPGEIARGAGHRDILRRVIAEGDRLLGGLDPFGVALLVSGDRRRAAQALRSPARFNAARHGRIVARHADHQSGIVAVSRRESDSRKMPQGFIHLLACRIRLRDSS